MNENLNVVLVLMGGFILGILFFGGLWFTILKSLHARNPGVWFLLSFLVRMSITITGFYALGGTRWEHYAATILGFLIARVVVKKYTDSIPTHNPEARKEVAHES